MGRFAKIFGIGVIVVALAWPVFAENPPQSVWDFDSVAAAPAAPHLGYMAGKEINVLFEQMASCWNSGDLEGYLDHFWKSPILIVVEDGVTLTGWQDVHDKFMREYVDKSAMGRCASVRVQVRMTGPDTAFAINYWTVSFPKNVVVGMDTNQLQRIGGVWKIIASHSSNVEM